MVSPSSLGAGFPSVRFCPRNQRRLLAGPGTEVLRAPLFRGVDGEEIRYPPLLRPASDGRREPDRSGRASRVWKEQRKTSAQLRDVAGAALCTWRGRHLHALRSIPAGRRASPAPPVAASGNRISRPLPCGTRTPAPKEGTGWRLLMSHRPGEGQDPPSVAPFPLNHED